MSYLMQNIRDRIKYQILHQDDLETEKIFVIGLSRTGTTSITRALEILGYKSIHFAPIGRVSQGKLKFEWSWWLNKYDGFSDIPVTHFFVELDRKFPRKKFIQTVREKNSWLESAKKHFSVPSQHEYARLIHKELYGDDIFEPKLFSAAYDRHQSKIDRYFTGRSDFMKIDICAGEGWEKLCPFLNQNIPNVEFPISNQNPQLVLTPLGLKRLREAIREAEKRENEGKQYSIETLSQRIGLNSQTIADILQGDIQLDRRKFVICFSTFGLKLKEEDYQIK